MKKLLWALLFFFPMMALDQAVGDSKPIERFQKGTHYKIIKGLPVYTKPTVTEMFSIYCGACYQWEKGPLVILKEWLKQQNIDFKQVHVDFMGSYAKEVTMALAMTSGTERYNAVKDALWDRIHVQRKGDWRSDSDFFKTLEKAGLEQSEFESNQNNLMLINTVLSWKQYDAFVHSVPSFIVNNRYLIDISKLKSHDDLKEIVAYLTQIPVE